MRICVLGCKSFPPGKWAGGIETNVQEVISRLKDRVEFHVLARQGGPVNGVKVHEVPYLDFRLTRTPSHNLFSIARAKRLIEREGIDFIHAHESFAGMAARILKRLTGTPYLLTMHAIDSDQPEWKAFRKPLSAIERFAVGGADMLTCPGPLIRKRVVLELGAKPDITMVVPNGVDVGRYGKIGRLAAKKKMDAPPDRLIIFTGRLTESKGLFPLLEAMRELKNHTLWLVGSGPLEKQLKRVAPGNVKFLGFRRDIPELLAASDIFVLPSASEGQPISLLEAMAAGVPVIASEVGEIPSVVGRDGLLIKPGSAKEMRVLKNWPSAILNPTKTLLRAYRLREHRVSQSSQIVSAVRKFEDRGFAARLAGRAKRRVRREYDWDVVAEKFYGVYETMMMVKT